MVILPTIDRGRAVAAAVTIGVGDAYASLLFFFVKVLVADDGLFLLVLMLWMVLVSYFTAFLSNDSTVLEFS